MSPRQGIPPYEIMNRSKPTTSVPGFDEPVPPEPQQPLESERSDASGLARWLNNHPILIRLPRGYALLLCAGALAMLIVAYAVGYARGKSTWYAIGKAEAEAEHRNLPQYRLSSDGGPATGGSPGVDRRQPGLNYLVLARYPKADAQRLVQFLAAHQVETALVPVNNGRLYHVVDLAGFERTGVDAFKQRELLLRRLGRIWKARHRGPSDLSDMWPQKYAPGES